MIIWTKKALCIGLLSISLYQTGYASEEIKEQEPPVLKQEPWLPSLLPSLLHMNLIQDRAKQKATTMALAAKDKGLVDNFQNCVIVVAAGLVTWGAQTSGPIGAAVGAGAGIPLAQIGCKAVGF